MARAKISPIVYVFIFVQICSRQQCAANTIPQQTVQNNVINTQNLNQNVDLANFNAQKQAVAPQPNLNLQFASVPMQTFNIQQQANSQQQGHSQQASYQAVNQALNVQQVPQHYNFQQEVPINNQQAVPSAINFQQAAAVPVNSQPSTKVHTTPQAVIVQQSPTVQGLNLQQQAYPINLQQSSQSMGMQQTAQPVKVQQQTTQQIVPLTANSQNQGAFQMGNLQKGVQTTSQQPSIIQPVTYQHPVQQHDQIAVTQLNVLQPHTFQQSPLQQIDYQQQIPCNNRGNYQVISYQKPCQLSEANPKTLPISSLSSNTNPTIIAAVPTTMTIPSTATQISDQIYVLSPQNYLTSTSYSPTVVTDTLQSTLSGPTIQVPIITVPNSVPSPINNFATSNCNQQFEAENWTWSQKIPDIGIVNDLQFPIASLLGQPTSSVQSALLSSILSSIQGPATSSQYILSSTYPAQTIISPQSSKLSLKSLLPLLLNMLQEKYTSSGCQCCNCCNCECSKNKNVMQVNTKFNEPHEAIETPMEVEEGNVPETIQFQNDESNEIEEVPVNPRQRKKLDTNQNVIPNDSTEIDEVENSSCVDDEVEDEDDLTTHSKESNRT